MHSRYRQHWIYICIGAILLWSWMWIRNWSWSRRWALRALYVCWYQNRRHQCWSHAWTMGISNRPLSRNGYLSILFQSSFCFVIIFIIIVIIIIIYYYYYYYYYSKLLVKFWYKYGEYRMFRCTIIHSYYYSYRYYEAAELSHSKIGCIYNREIIWKKTY